MRYLMKRTCLTFVLCFTVATVADAQEPRASWQRRADTVRLDMHLFHSTQSFHLPTAETLQKGVFGFEISHRFVSAISNGADGLYGLDGPVNMRLALGYAFTDHFAVTLARSNWRDNLDLQFKYRVFERPHERFPIVVGVQGGAAWNTEFAGRGAFDSESSQLYGQLIVNTLINEKIGVGLVPSYVRNADISDNATSDFMFTVGAYGHYYTSELVALMLEWNLSDPQPNAEYNTVSLGFQLETGGHFFKVLLTNATSLNPSQYLVGSPYPFEADELRLGFNITRLLH